MCSLSAPLRLAMFVHACIYVYLWLCAREREGERARVCVCRHEIVQVHLYVFWERGLHPHPTNPHSF